MLISLITQSLFLVSIDFYWFPQITTPSVVSFRCIPNGYFSNGYPALVWSIYYVAAENIAKEFAISREQQDLYAEQSQLRTEVAQKADKFSREIVAVTYQERKQAISVDSDEFPRPGTSVASLAKLRPAFLQVSSPAAIFITFPAVTFYESIKVPA